MNHVRSRLLSGLLLAIMVAGCNAAPTNEKVTEVLKPIMPPSFSVKSIENFSALKGVYEVVVVIDNQPTVLYLDSKLKHVISGSVVEIASKKNLTYETQMKNKPAGQQQPAAQQPAAPVQKAK